MPTAYGNTPSDVARMDLAREAAATQQGQFLMSALAQAVQAKQARDERRREFDLLRQDAIERDVTNRDLLERRFKFTQDQAARDAELDQLRLAGELERLESQKALNDARASGLPSSGIAIEQMRERERAMNELKAREDEFNFAQNLSGMANEYSLGTAEQADLKRARTAYADLADKRNTFRFGFGRTPLQAEQVALDEIRGQLPYTLPLPETVGREGEVLDLISDRAAALDANQKLLEPALTAGMKSGGVELIRQGQGGRWSPSMARPQSFRFARPDGELVYRQRQLSGMIDAELEAKPSYLDAYQNGVPLTKDSIKEIKDRRRESDTRLKAWREELADVEKRITEFQTDAEEKKTTRFGKSQPPLVGPMRYDSEAEAWQAGHQPGDKVLLFDPMTRRYRPAELLP